ncbi:hypothetical protein C8R45DRAFT_929457 [Mycena sanguinolenta]|nr:hypothetical protein C8R45DRAFT_929457 [Mycena sanguinolenta]
MCTKIQKKERWITIEDDEVESARTEIRLGKGGHGRMRMRTGRPNAETAGVSPALEEIAVIRKNKQMGVSYSSRHWSSGPGIKQDRQEMRQLDAKLLAQLKRGGTHARSQLAPRAYDERPSKQLQHELGSFAYAHQDSRLRSPESGLRCAHATVYRIQTALGGVWSASYRRRSMSTRSAPRALNAMEKEEQKEENHHHIGSLMARFGPGPGRHSGPLVTVVPDSANTSYALNLSLRVVSGVTKHKFQGW